MARPPPGRVPAMDDAPAWVREAVAKAPWRGGLEPGSEVGGVEGRAVQGAVPEALEGRRFFAAGVGRLRVGEAVYGHWFDGDGSVAKVTFEKGGKTTLDHKFVRSKRFVAQERRGLGKGMACRGVWTEAAGGVLRNLFREPSNPRNTSVVFFADRLHVLCEGGQPALLDADTLATKELEATPKDFKSGCFASAHPRLDPVSGCMFNFGSRVGPGRPSIDVWCVGPDYKTQVQRNVILPFFSMVHDFVITERHVVIVIVPYLCELGDVLGSFLAGRPMGKRFKLVAEHGTTFIVLRKDTLEEAFRCVHKPCFTAFHHANAYDVCDDSGKAVAVRVTVCQQRDGDRAALEEALSNLYESKIPTSATSDLWEYELSLVDRKVASSRPVCNPAGDALGCDFPCIHPSLEGRPHRYVYVAARTDAPSGHGNAAPRDGEGGYFDALQKIDARSGEVETHVLPHCVWGGEPCFVPTAEPADGEDKGYVLCIAYDASKHTCTVVIVDAANFSAPPVCVLSFAAHVPYRFHTCCV